MGILLREMSKEELAPPLSCPLPLVGVHTGEIPHPHHLDTSGNWGAGLAPYWVQHLGENALHLSGQHSKAGPDGRGMDEAAPRA